MAAASLSFPGLAPVNDRLPHPKKSAGNRGLLLKI